MHPVSRLVHCQVTHCIPCPPLSVLTASLAAGSGFSAYAKINPFAMATANAKSSSFGFGASSTPKDGSVGALRPNFTMPAPLSVPSPRSPKANPFSSPSPAHNPFMTIVESKDDLWKVRSSPSPALYPTS